MGPKILKRPDAVLFDRDGTLVIDVPYNGDPDRVQLMPGAAAALDLLRLAGLPVGMITNQSGVGKGMFTLAQMTAVNARVEELLGPFDVICYCPHTAEDHCECRKPAPGMVTTAARSLDLDPTQIAVVGDIEADVKAAYSAGAQAVLVPTAHTRFGEIVAAPHIAADILSAVRMLLSGTQCDEPETGVQS